MLLGATVTDAPFSRLVVCAAVGSRLATLAGGASYRSVEARDSTDLHLAKRNSSLSLSPSP